MRAALALVVASLLLAGCVGGDSKTGPTTSPLETEATVDAGRGGIEGLVMDDELVPLAGAQIALVGTGLTTESNAGGAFAFSKLEPGDYALAVSKLGYKSHSQKVSVKAEEVTEIDVALDPLPISEPAYDEVMKFGGQLPVSNACAEREAIDLGAAEEWPEQTRGVTWQKYAVPVNATKADGTEILGIRMKLELKHQPNDVTVDIDMRLVDPDGKTLADGWTESADELIDHMKVLKTGVHTVYVCYWEGAQADFKITATITYEQGDRAKYLRENPKEIDYPDA